MSHAGFKDAIDALSFIFAGKAIVTMTSAKTDTHFTFKVTRAEDGGAFFVKLLTGPDNSWNGNWKYIGYLKAVDGVPILALDGVRTSGLIAGRKGNSCAPSFKALSWALAHLGRDSIPSDLTIQHNDTCGHCGRELTDPISVAIGLGPVCRAA